MLLACLLLLTVAGCGLGDRAGGQDEFKRIATLSASRTSYGTPSRFSVAFADGDRGWLAVYEDRLYRTQDGGHSWQAASGPITGSFPGAVLPKDIRDVDRLAVLHCLGKKTIWVSYAAASTQQPEVPDPRPMEWDYHEGVRVLLVSRDGGRSWRTCESLPLKGLELGSTSWESERRGWVSAYRAGDTSPQPKYVFETNDGGRTWRRYPATEGVDDDYYAGQTTSAPSRPNGFPWRPSTSKPGSLEIDWRAGGLPLHTTSSWVTEFGPVQGNIDGTEYHHLFGDIYFTDERHGFVDADNGVWATNYGAGHWKRVQRLPWDDPSDIHSGQSEFVRAGASLLLLRSVDTIHGPAPQPSPPSGGAAIEVYARPVPVADE